MINLHLFLMYNLYLSARTAQSPISCQLCSNSVVIKWKCTDCELLLCDNCKVNVHSRFKSSDKHRVVSTGDIGYDITDQPKGLYINKVISSVFNTYQTELPGIHKMICNDEDEVFLLFFNIQNSHFIKAKLRKNSIKVLQQFDIASQDFTVNRESEIIFAPAPIARSELRSLSSNGDSRTILKTPPMMVLSIHLNKHGELVLGLREQGPIFPVTDFSTRQVVILNTDYQRKATFEYDDSGRKLFSYADRITSDPENNIYVLDVINDNYHGRIVGFDKNRRKKFIYNGHHILNTQDTPFAPTDIVMTPTNVVLITEMHNHAIHALTEKGELCGLQNTTHLGICYPHSLSFDTEGFLLIGCCRPQGETSRKALLHAVKIYL